MSSEWNFTFCRWISFSCPLSLMFSFIVSLVVLGKCVSVWYNKRYFIIPENALLWFDMNGNCCFVVVCCYYLSTSLPTVSCQKLDWQTIWPGHVFVDDSLLHSMTLHTGTMNKICWIWVMAWMKFLFKCVFSILSLYYCVCVYCFIVLLLLLFRLDETFKVMLNYRICLNPFLTRSDYLNIF